MPHKRETRVCTQYKDYSEKIIFFEKAKKAREYIDPNDASYLFYLALIDDPKYMEKIKLACDQSRLPGVRLGMSARQVIEFTNWESLKVSAEVRVLGVYEKHGPMVMVIICTLKIIGW